MIKITHDHPLVKTVRAYFLTQEPDSAGQVQKPNTNTRTMSSDEFASLALGLILPIYEAYEQQFHNGEVLKILSDTVRNLSRSGELDQEDYRYTMNAWSESFAIFARYESGHAEVSAEHDIIYAGSNDINPNDIERLESLGWHYDDHLESFYHYT